MKILKLFFPLLLLSISSCSNSLPQSSYDQSEEVAQSEAFLDEEVEVIEVADEIFSEIAQLEGQSSVSRMDTIYDSKNKIEVHNQQKQERILEALTQNIHEYQVQPGDTLMLIAYKTLGDYRFWRFFEDWNPEIQGSATSIKPGQTLKYDISYKKDYDQPSGLAYMILKNDTLGLISHKVYEDKGSRWRHLYENNKTLIYDPNVIFAGFTLYYLPLELLEPDRTPADSGMSL